MDTELYVAMLGCMGTVMGSMLGVAAAASKTNHRLKQLEMKVEKHNHLVERMVAVKCRTKGNEHRIDDLEREGRKIK